MLITTQRIRVEWGHCDPARIIFNPNYYIWMDHGTHALLLEAGYDLAADTRDGKSRGCPLVTSTAQFHAPAYHGDILTLKCTTHAFGNKSFTIAHEFSRDDKVLCTGTEVRVWAGYDKNDPDRLFAVPVPAGIREGLSQSRQVALAL